MTFSDFTSVAQIEKQFALSVRSLSGLFAETGDAELPPYFLENLDKSRRLAVAINTEKARSEFIIAPVLFQAWTTQQTHTSLFSGIEFKVSPEEGLSGRCDFILSASQDMMFLTAPILTIVEAKNDNIHDGFAQCIAEMIAASRFNEAKKNIIPTIYGCVTTGTEWRFLRLRHEQNLVEIDVDEYQITNVERIIGILVHILQTAQQQGII
ncbi:MAG: hypothetical protein EAZ92_17670 [Candidatus Kapaibacterium sp.]|nr:MAG: hypothetical protein EAZ92_17670 [Candidatus Kapabacteria bacterium]